MSYGRRNSYGAGGYGGRRQSNFGGPKPVEVGKEYDVQVTERSDRGDGIARIQGFIIFVKNGKVGDKVKVKVTSVGNRFCNCRNCIKNNIQAQNGYVSGIRL